LIEKHRRAGLLIDANILLLLFVGRMDPRRIPRFKRTAAYSILDYDLLKKLVRRFAKILTTAHVLTEVSNLVSPDIRQIMKQSVEAIEELHQPSRSVMSHAIYLPFGLADAAIAFLGSKALVLTDDIKLCVQLQREGVDAINFNHLRQSAWRLT
jgi:rRNA-processing protein FCF1